jgi:opacity protein-like surface antigen
MRVPTTGFTLALLLAAGGIAAADVDPAVAQNGTVGGGTAGTGAAQAPITPARPRPAG